jgi:glycosyltransferase involved in cell wall biosynthesis
MQTESMNGVLERSKPRLCIVQDSHPEAAPPFIRDHAEHLPAEVLVIHGFVPHIDHRPLLSQTWWRRACRKVWRTLRRRARQGEPTAAYVRAFRHFRPDAVLAEFGEVAVNVMDACRLARVPLIAHFHGVDASDHQILQRQAEGYRMLFESAAAIIAVSRAMQAKLIALGAPPLKVHYNPYGVDPVRFCGAHPAASPPIFLAVGRFVDKKAPHLTLCAFAKVLDEHPSAELRMIGDGPLLEACQSLAKQLGIGHAVAFLGKRTHDVVVQEMRRARVFVQLSVEARGGDTEGTPVAVIEASAMGLPIVATRHAGIPDVVLDDATGLLVDEHDVLAMASHMLRLAREPWLAAKLGQAGQQRVRTHFASDQRIDALWAVIQTSMQQPFR